MISWLISKLRRPERKVVYPYRPLLNAMRAKDPDLYAVVGPMIPSKAVAVWRQKYPEDFAQ